MSKDEKFAGRVTEVGASRRGPRGKGSVRDFSNDFDSGGVQEIAVKDRAVLQQTPTGRLHATATVYESKDRPFESLTLQRWDGARKPLEAMSLNAKETTRFIEFVHRIKTTTLDTASRFKIYDRDVDTVIAADDIDLEKLEAAAKHDPAQAEAFAKLAEEYSLRDLRAVAYRRGQLAHFKRLLEDAGFREEQRELHGGPEKLWQAFFEKNPWIFGYGLTYLPLAKLTGRTLEQFVQGRSIGGFGKEADAIMKSNALISGVTVVEIKTPFEKSLLAATPARAGVYHPSAELSQAVAQIQVSVQVAVEKFEHSLRVEDAKGDKTGEELHFVQPRSFLVMGHLSEMFGPSGVNDQKYRSFEVYRRSLRLPEIFTFDELYERARHIVSEDEPDP